MHIISFFEPPLLENSFILYDESNCFIIDPGSKYDDIVRFIENNKLKPIGILNTHGHFDHIKYNDKLKKYFSIKVFAHKNEIENIKNAELYADYFKFQMEEVSLPDEYLKDGDKLYLNSIEIKIIETFGHTAGSICFYLENNNIIFTGDTLFKKSFGRTDLPGGDFDLMKNSIKKLFSLKDETVVYCGHGAKTTIKDEKQDNIFLKYL